METNENAYRAFFMKNIRALNKSSIDYVLIGGAVVSFYGRPRSIISIDIIVERDLIKIERLEECLKKESLELGKNEIKEAILDGSHASIFDNKTILRLDIKVPTRNIEEDALKHKKEVMIFGKKTYVQIPEEIIIAKIIYGSDQDIDDAYSILLRLKKSLNYTLLKSLSKREGVERQLNELLQLLNEVSPDR